MSGKLVLFSTSMLLPLVVLLLAAMPAAKGATAGELLEKAIYAEETVGNLDEAVKLYEQVIAEGKTASSAAAKAQLRLGLIYEKQGKAQEAAAAFRAVVDKYPNETELVAQARKQLPSELALLPVPWVDGEELQLNMKLPTGLDIGTMIHRIAAAKHDGKDIWECTTRGFVSANGSDSFSHVRCDKETFAPIWSLWKHSLLGEAEATYSEESVVIKTVGNDQPLTLKIAPPVFDNEQAVQLFRRLPLKEGYKGTITVVTSLGGNQLQLGVEVTAKETIETPAGKFECYKLVLNIGQTFWVSTDEHRYIVRFAAGGVTADLVSIKQRSADATAELKGDGFSLALPAGWHGYSPSAPAAETAKKQVTYLLDPEAIVGSTVAVGPLDTLDKDERGSAKAWTESAIKGLTDMTKGFKVREPGVTELTMDGKPGAAMTADYSKDDKRKTLYGVAVMNGKRALNMRFEAPTEKFEELKPQFDAIVESLKLE